MLFQSMTSAAAAMSIHNHCAIIARSGAFLPKYFSRKVPSTRPMMPFSSSCRRPQLNSTATKRYAHQDQEDEACAAIIPPQNPYPPCAIQVPPPPSWSIHELRLTSSDKTDDADDETISKEELATLARRCLIDIRHLSLERREELRRHVGGIMRCASVLLESKDFSRKDGCDEDDGKNDACKNVRLTDEDVYDAPRGLTKMPIRREGEDDNDWTNYESKESNAIMQSQSVRSKMIRMDNDEMFFSVVTKR